MTGPQQQTSGAAPETVEHARRLLDLWFDGCQGLRAVSRFTSTHRGPSTDIYGPGDHDRMADAIAGYGQMFPSYVRTSTMSAPPKDGKRGGADLTLEIPGLYADVDGAWGTHKTELPLPPTIEAALEPLAGLPAPTVVIDSGGGLYPLWKLRTPIVDIDQGAEALQRWAAHLEQRYAAAGWHFDRLDNVDRILRWPGTLNTKAGDPRFVHARLELSTGAMYEIDELLADVPHLERAPIAVGADLARPTAPDGDNAFDALRGMGAAGHQWVAQALQGQGWTISAHGPDYVDLVRPGGSSDVSARIGGTHPTTGADLTGMVEVWSEAVPGVPTGSYTVGGFLTRLMFGGDLGACATWLASHGIGANTYTGRLDATAYLHAAGATEIEPPAEAAHLPDAFWQSRPELEHIRQAARARIVSPDAVLGCVLARVAANATHTLTIPAFAGKSMGLTFIAAVVGPSGSGKSSAMAAAADLIPAQHGVMDRLPAGSGEGMVDVLFDEVDEPDPDTGKKRVVYRQTRHAAVFEVDEGQVLAEIGARSGATLLPTLRSAFSHATLGQTNASKTRRRSVDGHTYVFGFLLGFQPEHAVAMLDDAAGGTPQRFVWFSAVDPQAEAGYLWPGALAWNPPKPTNDRRDPYSIKWVSHLVGFDQSIVTEVQTERVTRARGESDEDALDSHRTIGRLKVAALLAMLAGRLDVTVDDWTLSGQITHASSAVRADVQRQHRQRMREMEESATAKHVRRSAAVDTDAERREIERTVNIIAKRAQRHATDAEHEGEGCSRRCFTLALNTKMRPNLDLALDDAVRLEHLHPQADGRWLPGGQR